MVKADASKDYYAELGVPPDCTTEDIKKQFRKLALQLHPDRHPGHEDEYTARFQGVRAAHDVLADPDQRFKYDKNRRRGNINNNAFDRPSPPRRNAGSYNAPTTAWPPPPSRTNPRRSAQDMNPTPNSGASRYTNFVPPQQPTSAKQDARVRQSVFQAWRKMNQAQQAQTGGTPKPGPQYAPPPQGQNRAQPPPSPTMDEGRDSRYHQSSRPVSQQRSQSSWASSAPKKTGFDPLNKGGDEGPASRVGPYGSTPRYDRPDLPPRVSPTTSKRNDFSTEDVPYAEGGRERNPYTSVRHDRTDFSGSESLRRSATTRENSRMPRPNSYMGVESINQPAPMDRRKSADATEAGFAAGFASAAPDLKLPRPATHGADTNARAHPVYSDVSEDDSDLAASTRPQSSKTRHDSRGSGLSDASPEEGTQRQQGFFQRPNIPPSEAWAQRGNSPSSGRVQSDDGPPFKYAHGPFPTTSPSYPMITVSTEPGIMPTATESHSAPISAVSEKPPNEPIPSGSDLEAGKQAKRQRSQKARPGFESRSPIDGDNLSPTSTSDPKNTRLQDERSRAQGHNYIPTHPSPLNPDASPPNMNKSYMENSNRDDARSAGTFEADEWVTKMQEHNWAAQPPTSPSRTSPVRSGANTRRPGRGEALQPSDAPRHRAISPSAQDQEANEQGIPHSQRHNGNDSETIEGDPMDIDTEELGTSEARKPSIVVEDESGQRKARHIYVEPSRPEWQEQPTNGERRRSHGDIQRASPSRPNVSAGSPLRSAGGITMNDFRHVHPFVSGGTSGGGLGNVKDLSDNLPFPSQAAPSHPKRGPLYGEISPPSPPSPPPPPGKLTQASWNAYLKEMSYYIRDWNTFNSRVVGILQEFAMQFADMERGRDGNMVDDWLGAVGETEQLGGWDTYVKRFEEEKRVRAHWETALAQHEAAIQVHSRLRNKVMHSQSRH